MRVESSDDGHDDIRDEPLRSSRRAAGRRRPGTRRGPRTGRAAAAHDVHRVGRRRRDPRQVHAGGRPDVAVAGAELVAGADGHAELRPAAARSGAGVPAKSSKMDVTHWLIWNIPGTSTGLPEGVAGRRSAGRQPSGEPPRQRLHGPRRASRTVPSLHVQLYALDTKLDIPSGAPADAAKTRMAIDGRHGRPRPRQGRARRALPPPVSSQPNFGARLRV